MSIYSQCFEQTVLQVLKTARQDNCNKIEYCFDGKVLSFNSLFRNSDVSSFANEVVYKIGKVVRDI